MRIFVLLAAVSGIMLAQGGPMMPTLPIHIQSNYDELKSVLNLTDQQITQLKQLQQERTQATQAAYQQIAQKQKALNDLLSSGSTDAMAIGRLEIEIQNTRKQAPPGGASVRDQALAVLTADQKAKLATLQEALKLRTAADQAVGLNLLDYPQMQPRPLPMMPR
jgi:Spy/CpxP family protein refolding chaperone